LETYVDLLMVHKLLPDMISFSFSSYMTLSTQFIQNAKKFRLLNTISL